jgi:hypothetical protein
MLLRSTYGIFVGQIIGSLFAQAHLLAISEVYYMTMFYRSYTPGPPLGDFIGRFWLCSDTPSHSRERMLPSGTIELVFNLCESGCSQGRSNDAVPENGSPKRHKQLIRHPSGRS